MKIKIYEDRSYSRENFSNEGTENENLATTLYFQFPETVNGVQTSTLNKYIVFDINGEPNTDILTSNNSYSIPTAITQLGTVSFNIYLVAPTNNGEDSPFRWISKKITLNFNDANDMTEIVITVEEINIFNSLLSELNSAIANVELLEDDFEEFKEDYDELLEQFEQLNQNYQAAIQQVENVNIDANKINDTATVTITNKDGIQKEVTIKDGIDYEITSEDYQEIANIVEQDITPLIPTKVSQLENDSAYIKKEVNNLTNYYKKDETYTKQEVDNKVASVYKYKGTVATYADLPSLNLTIGDVYNVESDGSNYAWNGTAWDKLGGEVDLSDYYTKSQTDTLLNEKQNIIDNSHKLNADLVDDTSTTHKFTSTSEKSTWNAKYDKPSGGIPKTDLSEKVKEDLEKADEALDQIETIEEDLYGNIDVEAEESSIKLSGTKEGRDLSIKKIYGNSTQVQYEGYNLYQPTLDNVSKVNCTVTLNEDEFVFVATGTDMRIGAVSGIGENYYIGNGQKIDVTGKSNLSISLTNTDFNSIFFNAFDSNDVSLGYTNINSYKGSYSIPVNASYVTVRLGKNNAVSGTTYKTKVMVYEGTTEKPYEPYVGNQASPNSTYKQDINNVEGNVVVISKNSDNTKSNSVTFPLSQGQKLMLGDTLEDDGVNHKRRQIVLDGTENWVDYTTQVEGYYKAYCTTKKTNSKFGILTALCTHFKIVDVSLVARTDELLASNQFAVYISISSNIASTSANLKSWLAQQYANGTPVIVEYELAEETIDPYTEEQQEAYNKLQKMKQYDDITYITIDKVNKYDLSYDGDRINVLLSDVNDLKEDKEDKSNKITSIDENSTDEEYPSAKTVYDNFVTRDEEIEELQTKNAQLLADHPDILDENNEFPSGTDLTLNGTGDLEMSVDVGGNSTQIQYEGYNLLNIPNNEITLVKLTNRVVNISPINTLTLEAGTYTIVFPDLVLTNNVENLGVQLVGLESLGSTLSNKKRTITLTEQATLKYFYCFLASSDNDNATVKFTKIMLYEGTTEKPYEPYTNNLPVPNPTQKSDINNVEGDVVVKGSSKNLFTGLIKGIGLNFNNGSQITDNDSAASDYISVDFNTNSQYTLSGLTNKLNSLIAGYNANKEFIGRTSGSAREDITLSANSFTGGTAQGTGDIVYIRATQYKTSSSTDTIDAIDNLEIQLEPGSTVTPYVPHAENTVTFPLATGQKLMLGDTLEDDGVHHKRGQVVLDGSDDENWNLGSYNRFDIQIPNFKAPDTSVIADILCNRLIKTAKNQVAFEDNKISAADKNSSAIIIRIDDTMTTVSELRTYLQENSIIVEYPLETETIEPYTSAQQTAYNKLKEMQSYYDLTYVVGSSDNAQPILTAHAKKSIKQLSGGDLSNYQTKITSTNKLNSDLVNDTNQTNKFVTSTEKNTWNAKQNTTDNNLATTNKNITSAINEVNSIAKGANQALSYASYSAMITAFSSASSTDYNVGQNIYIETLDVPDLWVYKVESTSSSYTYTTDSAFTTALETNGYVQVGYYKLSALETQKVDLTNYVENTDYANATTGGVVKVSILTQSEYKQLQTIDTNTFYMIKEV